jgi:hypothetical protein
MKKAVILSGFSIKQKVPRRIGHLENFGIGQVSNLFLGQVTNVIMNTPNNWRPLTRLGLRSKIEE